MMKPKVLCIVGPTASGKSALGMTLAKKMHGEIICMDSMQVYRRLDIGTAKPTLQEQADIPHHLVDIREPNEAYTVAQYAQDAKRVIEDVTRRSKLPVMVGGTGFYLRALTHGLNLGGVPSNPQIRERLKAEAQSKAGKTRLFDRLKVVDPQSAARLHENDIARVSRALEVYELTGIPFSAQKQPAFESPFDFCIIGTAWIREQLYSRINARVDTMITGGLMDEVKALLDDGVSPQAQAMQGIGYKELVPVLCNKFPLKQAIHDIKRNSRHYAKRQLTWFRRDESIQWIDMAAANVQTKVLAIAQTFLEGTNA